MTKPIKLGIIGCGIAARNLHLPALLKLKDKFEITAVCNHTEPKAKDFAKLVGDVPYVLDYRDLLKRDDVEAVDIILPIHLNYQVTKHALEADKHVMVEKPLAANLTEAKEMLALEKRYSHVMMVGENFRYRPTFRRLKDMIESGKIGTPYSVFWNIFYFVESSNKYAQTQWRKYHRYPGGFITDAGVHNIAIMRDLFGDFISGTAFAKSINPEIGEMDTFSFQFKTDKNIAGVFNDFFSANGYRENRLIILGKSGTIIVEENTLSIKTNDQPDIQETIDDDGGYVGEFEDFYQAIRQGKKVTSTFTKAYHDLRVILKAIESAESGQMVSLRL